MSQLLVGPVVQHGESWDVTYIVDGETGHARFTSDESGVLMTMGDSETRVADWTEYGEILGRDWIRKYFEAVYFRAYGIPGVLGEDW